MKIFVLPYDHRFKFIWRRCSNWPFCNRDCLLNWVKMRRYGCDTTSWRMWYCGLVTFCDVRDDIIGWIVEQSKGYRAVSFWTQYSCRSLHRRRHWDGSGLWLILLLCTEHHLIAFINHCIYGMYFAHFSGERLGKELVWAIEGISIFIPDLVCTYWLASHRAAVEQKGNVLHGDLPLAEAAEWQIVDRSGWRPRQKRFLCSLQLLLPNRQGSGRQSWKWCVILEWSNQKRCMWICAFGTNVLVSAVYRSYFWVFVNMVLGTNGHTSFRLGQPW